jgi:prolyl oligopeptidase
MSSFYKSVRGGALGLVVCCVSGLCAAQSPYPPSSRGEVTETLHGVSVADPYRWLEDAKSPATSAWVEAQSKATEGFLASLPMRQGIRERYKALINFERYTVPLKEGGRYFWTRNDGLQQQAVLYSVRELKAKPQVILDPNTFSKDGTVSLAGFVPAPNGKLLAYATSSGGSDWTEWKVRDLDSGKDLPDTIRWVKFSQPSWSRDSKGFFYSRYDEPKAGAELTAANYFHKVYFHRLGTAQAQDVLIHENREQKEWGFQADVSHDGRFLTVLVWRGAGRENGLLVYPLNSGTKGAMVGRPTTVSLAFDAVYLPLGNQGNIFYLQTDREAPRGKIVRFAIGQPEPKGWTTMVKESDQPLEASSLVGGRLFGRYLKDVTNVIREFSLQGKLMSEVALPGIGSVEGFAGRINDQETFFSFTNITQPRSIYRYDLKQKAVTLFRAPKTAFDSSRYETRQVFVTSADGTRVPMFVAHRKGLVLNGENPTILTAYGGFNVSNGPAYRVMAATWLDQGGVYALANIRGGGEYGADWHAAAIKGKRQNAFDDMLAAAQWLTANGYAKAQRLGVTGGSNGGLLVGVVINQRPQAFGAAVPEVGVMDMLRFHRFTIGWAWKDEYGDPDNAADFKVLRAYSPLHNLKAQTMPHVLIMTSDHDDRVVPAHSFKYAAQLQALETGAAAKYIRIETRAGHGAGTPTSKIIEERGDVLTFFAHTLGLGKAACVSPGTPCLAWQ